MQRRGAVLTGAVVFVVALGLLLVSAHRATPPYPKAQAARAAARNPSVHAFLHDHRPTRTTVIHLDKQHWRVTFWDGGLELLDAAVDPRGHVDATEEHPPGAPMPGSKLLFHRPLILLLALLFMGALAVRPLRSLRNLDLLVVAAAFTAAAVLIDGRAVGPRVWAGAAGLAYVAFRCGWSTFRPSPEIEESAPLLTNARTLRMVAAAALLGGLVIVVTSSGTSDVAFAAAAGGTLLNHGIAPYGHLPADVVHGDTYPPLTYVLFMPAAAIVPVRDGFDSLDGALWTNAIALAATTALLWRSRGGTRWALAWLAFPPVLLAASGGGNDVVAAFFTTAAVLSLARPVLAASLLALAGWVKIGPAAALVPVLAPLRGEELKRSLAAVLAICVVGFAFLAVIGSVGGAVDGIRFQFDRGSWFSPWQQLGAHGLQIVFEAVSLGVIGAAAVVAASAPSVRRIAAAAGLTVALLQLGANYWTYAYLPWLLPFILVALFPPERLRSRTPAPAVP